MKHHSDKDINKLLSALVGERWTVEKQSKHIKVRSPHGVLVTMSASPSDHRATLNIKSDIKRAQRRDAELAAH